MSHPIPGFEYQYTCSFCKKIAVDSADFESGNNAEVPVSADLCEDHLEELEKLDYGFEDKYSDILQRLASEKLGREIYGY